MKTILEEAMEMEERRLRLKNWIKAFLTVLIIIALLKFIFN